MPSPPETEPILVGLVGSLMSRTSMTPAWAFTVSRRFDAAC
ncbi:MULTISPECIES: hypothetical protein [Corynebacterium]|nr:MULTISPECIES: hypothetical protein [Corynebacterium]WNI12545.1 hypothetical protein RIU96_10050 [Corynebacterium sp. Z-1]